MSLFQTYLEKVQNNYDEGIIDSIKNLGKKFLKLVGFEETKFDYWFFDKFTKDLNIDLSEDKIIYKKLVLAILGFLKSKNIVPSFVSIGPKNDLNSSEMNISNWNKKYCFFNIGNPKGNNKLGFYLKYSEDLKKIIFKYKFKNLILRSFDFHGIDKANFELRNSK
jgi:hypothetical protein